MLYMRVKFSKSIKKYPKLNFSNNLSYKKLCKVTILKKKEREYKLFTKLQKLKNQMNAMNMLKDASLEKLKEQRMYN